MADKQDGFFKRMFRFGKSERDLEKVPDETTDTALGTDEQADPVAHAEAAATVVADAEAGADTGADDAGGIQPIIDTPDPAQKKSPESGPAAAEQAVTPETAAPEPIQPETVEPAPGVQEQNDLAEAEAARAEAEANRALRAQEESDTPAASPDSMSFGDRNANLSTPPKISWFKRMGAGLSRTSAQLTTSISGVFTKRKLDETTLEELEDILIRADLGVETATAITDKLADQRMGKDVTDEEVRTLMAEEVERVLDPVAGPLELDLDHQPHVILVVGVNGSGKTTTIGKLGQKLYDAGFSTLLVAGDTFRAAAVEQLKIWGERTFSPVIYRPDGADAAGLAYDAYVQARDEGRDVVLMDTAGRLQNKSELMAELEKIIRVFKKLDPSAPHTVLLTLDATTGQNALQQVEIFKDVAGVNGLVMTKLDGTARGGILVGIAAKYGLPVYFIGVGEQVEDLEPFEARDFARSISGLSA